MLRDWVRERAVGISGGTLDTFEGPPTGFLLNEVRFAIPNELFTSTTTFGAEEIAFSIWAHVHGMAVLETTHLRGFDVDFAAYHPEALRRLVRGFTTEPS